LIALSLIIATAIVYWPALNHQFINYDDPAYVTQNRYVRMGLTYEAIQWAFTTVHMGNWNPLTWLSHMLDYQMYGLNPKGHHLTNIILHILNTLALFALLNRLTGRLWRSALVAAIFALHPLHVESVAWVSERKDVLSTLFFFGTILAYVFYVQKPTRGHYAAVIVLFVFGLMAKPMLVTLPCVLLLLDYWPLQRLTFGRWRFSNPSTKVQHHSIPGISSNARPFAEKVPLFILSAVFCILTIYAQRAERALISTQDYPVMVRISNALLAYINYLWKTFWPSNLAVIYPLPEYVPVFHSILALLFLVGISLLFLRSSRRGPFLLVGWLWFIGTLVPVIGLIQVELQAMADRYTYISSVGVYLLVICGVAEMTGKWRYRTIFASLSSFVVLGLLAFATSTQLTFWENSLTLFTHTLRVTNKNYIAHTNLGDALDKYGRYNEAMYHYGEALRIKPNDAFPYYKLATDLEVVGRTEDALRYYRKSLQIDPNNSRVHSNFGVALIRQGNVAEAKRHFAEALRLDPDLGDAHYNLGLALSSEGKIEEAISHYYEALRRNPSDSEIKMILEKALDDLAKQKNNVQRNP
jgi:protein O-mannosyl-transferase